MKRSAVAGFVGHSAAATAARPNSRWMTGAPCGILHRPTHRHIDAKWDGYGCRKSLNEIRNTVKKMPTLLRFKDECDGPMLIEAAHQVVRQQAAKSGSFCRHKPDRRVLRALRRGRFESKGKEKEKRR